MKIFLFALACSICIVACNKESKTSDAPAGGIDSTQLAPDGTSVTATDSGSADTTGPVATNIAVISTDSGDVEIELFGIDAPRTVKNFIGLAAKGYYDGIAFHRVIPGFVAQAGDPTTRDSTKRGEWGSHGSSLYGETFEDELDTSKPSAKLGYGDGIVAMANKAEPNTNSSQFFIVLSEGGAKSLTYSYTIFGRVRGSNDAVRRIESTGFQGEMPLVPARIKKITVRPA